MKLSEALAIGTLAVLMLTVFAKWADAETLLCLGDSISTEWEGNAAYCPRADMPEGWIVRNEGRRWASCLWVETLTGDLIDTLEPGDVVSLMCRHVDAIDYAANVDAVLNMEARASAVGAFFFFQTQPRWDVQGGNEYERDFWDDVASQLHPESVYFDHWQWWTQRGYYLWLDLYNPDLVHMAEGGAFILADVLERVMRENCFWLPLYPYPWCSPCCPEDATR